MTPNKPFPARRQPPAFPPPPRRYFIREDADAPDAKALADDIVARRRAERRAMFTDDSPAIPRLLAVRGDLY